MGAVLSRIKILRIAVQEVLALSKSYEELQKRIEASPGLPVPNPTRSFWMDVPATVAETRPNKLPEYADVVILGSGITGAAVARTLLEESRKVTDGLDGNLRVVMLEARDACSGATGR